jgi:DNA mismatch endonuclease (patch repair protein)
VFPAKKVVVFVDGDFWHGGGWRERGFKKFEDQFGRNARFWIGKIKSNVERDKRVNAQLRAMGWKVIRLWESQVRKSPERCARRVHRVIERRERLK